APAPTPAPAAVEATSTSRGAQVLGEEVTLEGQAPTAPTTARPAQVLGESFERAPATLAYTGVNTAKLLAAGVASILVGIGLLLASRRRLVKA
ncbi:MAG TPA: hypothetical protein VHN98_03215, partial [Acidimicrobiales bacterium]|nr:hypothetical protein [Acidimicrobiales bacterium]